MRLITMRHLSSLQKSITTASLWTATVVGGVFATQGLSTQLSQMSSTQMGHTSMQLTQSRPTLDDSESGNRDMPLVAIAVATGVAVVGVKAAQSSHVKNKSQSFQPSAVRFAQASRPLQRKLLTLVHDDQKVADRLLTQTKLHHPERSIDWCAEKVIYDLKRDRH